MEKEANTRNTVKGLLLIPNTEKSQFYPKLAKESENITVAATTTTAATPEEGLLVIGGSKGGSLEHGAGFSTVPAKQQQEPGMGNRDVEPSLHCCCCCSIQSIRKHNNNNINTHRNKQTIRATRGPNRLIHACLPCFHLHLLLLLLMHSISWILIPQYGNNLVESTSSGCHHVLCLMWLFLYLLLSHS